MNQQQRVLEAATTLGWTVTEGIWGNYSLTQEGRTDWSLTFSKTGGLLKARWKYVNPAKPLVSDWRSYSFYPVRSNWSRADQIISALH